MDEDIIKQRALWLRDISQGEGVHSWEKLTVLRDDWKELFEVDNASDLKALIDYGLKQEADNPFVKALANAMKPRPVKKGSSDFMNLTDRRTIYLQENPSVSYRTLVRYESEGAEIVARYVDVARRGLEQSRLESDPAEGLEVDIEVLRQRVLDLEKMVSFYGMEFSMQGARMDAILRATIRLNARIENREPTMAELSQSASSLDSELTPEEAELLKHLTGGDVSELALRIMKRVVPAEFIADLEEYY